MGVYIKGMTLEQFNEFMDILGGIMNPSKLIEVTEPHGDLIDRDALPIEDLNSNVWLNSFGVSVENLETAPTVIEAEGE